MGRFEDFVVRNPVTRLLAARLPGTGRDAARLLCAESGLEWASRGEIEAYQLDRLRELLDRARHAPYWRGVLEPMGPPSRFTLGDLPRLPFLTKALIRRHGRAMRIPGAKGVRENYSGGSTGEPVGFVQDRRYKAYMSVATRLANQRAGAFPGARVAKLWGAPQDRRKIEGPLGRAKLWLLNQRYYDSFDMAPERMLDYHRRMTGFAPDLIQAYSSSIYLFARFLASRGIRPDYPRVSIISSAERLHPYMRDQIERVFPVRVFDRYGSREVSAIAAECGQHDGLHIHEPGYIVESIRPETAGSAGGVPGELAITVLNNHAMPFLRYRIGDMASLCWDRCACGRTTARLVNLLGRTSDNFLMPDGRIVHGEYFTHIFYGREDIEQFQFVQEARSRFRLRLVPSESYQPATARRIEEEVREIIGGDATLAIERCVAIPKSASGKYRFTVSELDIDGMLATEVTR